MEIFEEFVKNDLLEKCRSAILNNFQFLEDDMKVREFKKLYLDKEKLQKQLSQLQQEKEETIKLIENLKQFYIEDAKNINFIPLSNFTKNINILLSKLKESDKDVS